MKDLRVQSRNDALQTQGVLMTPNGSSEEISFEAALRSAHSVLGRAALEPSERAYARRVVRLLHETLDALARDSGDPRVIPHMRHTTPPRGTLLPRESLVPGRVLSTPDFNSIQRSSRSDHTDSMMPAESDEMFDLETGRSEMGERCSAFLADASNALSASLDYRATIESVAALAVPALGDWSVVHGVREDGSVLALARAHVDPDMIPVLDQMLRSYPVDQVSGRAYPQCLDTGKSEVTPQITEDALRAMAVDADHLDLLRQLGSKARLCVPMVARGRTLGALTVVSSEASQQYGAEDLALAENLAHRAALSIDNARLYDDAQRAIRAREEFVAVACHELRTPLTSLSLLIQKLHNDGRGLEKIQRGGDLVDTIARANKQVRRLASLIENLLDVTRMASGQLKLEIEEVDLSMLAHDVGARMSEQAERAGCSLTVRGDPRAVGTWDRIRLDQAVTNLLSNAIKYAPGQPIELDVSNAGAKAFITVADHGTGIEQRDLERIFQKFERATTEHYHGSLGLGLYITRQIIEAHGGKLGVVSQPGHGARFTIELPLQGMVAASASQ